MSDIIRRLLLLLYESIVSLEASIAAQNVILETIAKENEACKRLMQIPGVGVMTATILLTMVGAASDFKNVRQFAAYIGLIPRQ